MRTRLIRSFTLFEISVKFFANILLSFHVENAWLIRISTYFEGNLLLTNGFELTVPDLYIFVICDAMI